MVPARKKPDESYDVTTLELLDHPNLVKVLKTEVFPENLTFLQEWMYGSSLHDLMRP
jgi:serine/threonine protein kinase